MNITEIRVEDRHRLDLGNLEELTASIRELGLLHPVVVTVEGRLVAGRRRLEACRKLGWTDIPVTIARTFHDAASLLRAERDENTCRKEMKPSEKVALGMALEALEKPRAEARCREWGREGALKQHGKEGSGKSPDPSSKGQARDLVGRALGWSGRTYEKARKVLEAARTGEEEAVRAAAQMDRTGTVWPAYQRVLEGRKATRETAHKSFEVRVEEIRAGAERGSTAEQIGSSIGLTKERVRQIARKARVVFPAAVVDKARRIDVNRFVEETVVLAANLNVGMEVIDRRADELDHARIGEWVMSLQTSIRSLNQLVRKLKGISRHGEE